MTAWRSNPNPNPTATRVLATAAVGVLYSTCGLAGLCGFGSVIRTALQIGTKVL